MRHGKQIDGIIRPRLQLHPDRTLDLQSLFQKGLCHRNCLVDTDGCSMNSETQNNGSNEWQNSFATPCCNF